MHYITQMQDAQGNVHYPQTRTDAVLHEEKRLNDILEFLQGASFPNLLDNWDFRNPVNQRGKSGVMASEYCIDRWIGNDTVRPDGTSGVTLSGGASLEQRIDRDAGFFAGKSFVFSVMVDGAVKSVRLTWPSEVGTFQNRSVSGFGNITIGISVQMDTVGGKTAYYPYIIITPTAQVTIEAVKLELGDISTLHLDPPMDYDAELCKCMRFYQCAGRTPESSGTTGGRYLSYNVQPTQITICIEFPTMRKTPTAASNSFVGETVKALGGEKIGDLTYVINTLKNGKLVAAHTRTSGELEMVYVNPNSKIWLSADL